MKSLAARREERQAERRANLDAAEERVEAQRAWFHEEQAFLQRFAHSGHATAEQAAAQHADLERQRNDLLGPQALLHDELQAARGEFAWRVAVLRVGLGRGGHVERALRRLRGEAWAQSRALRRELVAEEGGVSSAWRRAEAWQRELEAERCECASAMGVAKAAALFVEEVVEGEAALRAEAIACMENERREEEAVQEQWAVHREHAARQRTLLEASVARADLDFRAYSVRQLARRHEEAVSQSMARPRDSLTLRERLSHIL